jgi:uncharacterized protein (UPF0262 family)
MIEPEDKAAPDPALRLIAIVLDPQSLGRSNPDIEHEREVAIFDLIEENIFELEGREKGPYRLSLGIAEDRLVLHVRDEADKELASFLFSLSPFRRIVKDYFLVCESYFEAIKTAPASKIEAIDMGRRGLHDEGSRLLLERLRGKIRVDFPTARRLFTLICALHWRG